MGNFNIPNKKLLDELLDYVTGINDLWSKNLISTSKTRDFLIFKYIDKKIKDNDIVIEKGKCKNEDVCSTLTFFINEAADKYCAGFRTAQNAYYNYKKLSEDD